MTVATWSFRPRNYEEEAQNSRLASQSSAEDHPLTARTTATGTSGTSSLGEVDPLRIADPLASSVDDDPLAAFHTPTTGLYSSVGEMDDSFEPWESKTPGILARYTTNEKLSLASDILGGKGPRLTGDSVSDKVKSRLEELDEDQEQETDSLTQQEFVERIENYSKQLAIAWHKEQRVNAIKLVIQCSKLLGQTEVIKFYPSKFVLITNILDKFGDLVFQRLIVKANEDLAARGKAQKLPEDFTADMVPTEAKEICQNWFFKIASIRELLPRLLVETAMLNSYRFLGDVDVNETLKRLTMQMRGIGDPLVAAYSRCYLCRVGVRVAPRARSYLMPLFNDLMATMPQLDSEMIQQQTIKERVTMAEYLNLYTPALDWIMQCVAHKADDPTLHAILDACQSTKNSSVLLNGVIASFPPQYVSSRASQFIHLIKEASDTGLPKYQLFQTLGFNVSMSPPPEDDRKTILNEVWSVVTKLERPEEYVACAEAWIEYPVKYFSPRQVNTMLADIVVHLSRDRAYSLFYGQLHSILNKILSHMRNFSDIFSMDSFLPFFDLFHETSVKSEASKTVLETFANSQQEPLSDPVALSGMMYLCKIAHDGMTAMSFEDERKRVAELVIAFLSKTSFGRNFESALEFFVEARGNFSNLDAVLKYIVHRVNSLIMQTHAIVGGKHNRKTSQFVRSCIAFNFITVPSISDYMMRLKLYNMTGCVAIVNHALSQADVFFNAAIDLIPDLPDRIDIDATMELVDPFLVDAIRDLLSALLMLPDHPEKDRLFMLKRLFTTIQARTWKLPHCHAEALVATLQLLAALSQQSYLYGAAGVEANDVLYASSSKFIGDVTTMASSVLDAILVIANDMPEGEQKGAVLCKAFETMARTGDLKTDAILRLTADFGKMARKQSSKSAETVHRIVRELMSQQFPHAEQLQLLCA
eukprot:m.163872 g.163872  ORF g.163872 m.163872 type:complete len:929 (+) comp16396_c7_seq1:53-2839(+)